MTKKTKFPKKAFRKAIGKLTIDQLVEALIREAELHFVTQKALAAARKALAKKNKA